ncbi:1-propanol dehydrogenase PduQ [[Clostridium] aminophilum]|uniref:1-propanol dehydrogenase PduQ n=1 Tax=[Clostridium] aminophilum TaxID=1526 RepID=UPI00331CE0CB
MNQVYIKTRVFSGEDSLERLRKFEKKKIWIISDTFLVDNGTIDRITEQLDRSNRVVLCSDVVPDPPLSAVAKGVALMGNIHPDIIIAFGGGSAIDTAKGIIYFAKFSGFTDGVRFIAIPTTSGTGSEVSSVTVITDPETKIKHPIVDDEILPDEVILCPQLTCSVPPSVTANTGMDVLTHALEAYVSRNANAYSDALAEKAVEYVFGYLKRCCADGNDMEARSRMQEASNLAGSAFNIAGLGMNHAIAHQLGGIFHIPHGLANSLILINVIRKNSAVCEMRARYAVLARKLNLAGRENSDFEAVNLLCEKIRSCQKEMKIPVTFSELGIRPEAVLEKSTEIWKNAQKDMCSDTAIWRFDQCDVEDVLQL